jgi:ATP-dependent Clp protease adaptor protein ClpS
MTTTEQQQQGNTAVAEAPSILDRMPPWKVLLHNDDVNEMGYVIETIVELTSLNRQTAILRTLEAHQSKLALLMTTHREYAELLAEQFASKRLTVSIERD